MLIYAFRKPYSLKEDDLCVISYLECVCNYRNFFSSIINFGIFASLESDRMF